MNLYITDKEDEIGLGNISISIEEFNDIRNYPYIVSSKFDVVIVDIDDRIKHGAIGKLAGVTKVIPRLPDNITIHTVRLLSELYKDNAAELRIYFMRDRSKFDEVVESLRKQFDWDAYL